MDRLLKKAELLWKVVEIVEGDSAVVQELNLANNQLKAERARADMAEASSMVMSTCLD